MAGACVLAVGAATGEINADFYSITIDSARQTPEQLARELGSDFNAIVFAGSPGRSFRAYDAANAAIWRRNDPIGEVMTLVLAKTFSAQIEKGSVLVSCALDTDWKARCAHLPKQSRCDEVLRAYPSLSNVNSGASGCLRRSINARNKPAPIIEYVMPLPP